MQMRSKRNQWHLYIFAKESQTEFLQEKSYPYYAFRHGVKYRKANKACPVVRGSLWGELTLGCSAHQLFLLQT